MTTGSCYLILTSLLSALPGSVSQTEGNTVSFESKIEEELECVISGTDISVQWIDATSSTTSSIFAYFAGQTSPFNQSSDFKHNNFNYSFVQGSAFKLIINKVERSDGGVYICIRTLSGGQDTASVVYSLSVEGSVSRTGGSIVSYESRNREELKCDILGRDISVQWIDVTTGTSDPLFAYFSGQTSPFNQSSNFKHNNFNYSFLQESAFNLIINKVERGDEGVYDCIRTLSGGIDTETVTYSLSVEVLPSSIGVKCTPRDECPEPEVTESDLPCTCTAYDVYPESLHVEWKSVTSYDETSYVSDRQEDLFNISTSAVLQPAHTETRVICKVTNYNSTGIDETKISEEYTFAPPICDISVTFDTECFIAYLNCRCTAAIPEVQWYSYYSDSSTLLKSSNNYSEVIGIPGNGTYAFSCRGCNGVNYGDSSYSSISSLCIISPCTYDPCRNNGTCEDNLPEEGYTCICTDFYIGHDCETATACASYPCLNGGTCEINSPEGGYSCTCEGLFSGQNCEIPPEPTTPEATISPPEKGKNCPGHVAGLVIEAILITILAAIVVLLVYVIRRDSSEKHRATVSGDDQMGNNNPAYMDLQERHLTVEGKSSSLEIPPKNVKTVSELPGRGLMTYRKAILITNSGNRDAVVKSASEDAPVKLEMVWSSEIPTLQSLPQNTNVVKILGWCNSVPQLLVFEYVSGGNLTKHLTENFSSHKVHQYSNTKQKRFEVPETGKVENLPRYAFDVAKGLKFLLTNKLIHPGLRAQKVLIDLSGKCMIYDFVSLSRAKNLTKLSWAQAAPYQWMSPEFLFLGSVAAPGDVWSFGVLMWEIFSYGSQPYLGEDRSAVEVCIRREERLSMPQNCPGAVWQLMNRCWDQSVDTRPTMEEIASKLAAMCNDDKEYDEIKTEKTEV